MKRYLHDSIFYIFAVFLSGFIGGFSMEQLCAAETPPLWAAAPQTEQEQTGEAEKDSHSQEAGGQASAAPSVLAASGGTPLADADVTQTLRPAPAALQPLALETVLEQISARFLSADTEKTSPDTTDERLMLDSDTTGKELPLDKERLRKILESMPPEQLTPQFVEVVNKTGIIDRSIGTFPPDRLTEPLIEATYALSKETQGILLSRIMRALATIPPDKITDTFIQAALTLLEGIQNPDLQMWLIYTLGQVPQERVTEAFVKTVLKVSSSKDAKESRGYIVQALARVSADQLEQFISYAQQLIPPKEHDEEDMGYFLDSLSKISSERLTDRLIELVLALEPEGKGLTARGLIIDILSGLSDDQWTYFTSEAFIEAVPHLFDPEMSWSKQEAIEVLMKVSTEYLTPQFLPTILSICEDMKGNYDIKETIQALTKVPAGQWTSFVRYAQKLFFAEQKPDNINILRALATVPLERLNDQFVAAVLALDLEEDRWQRESIIPILGRIPTDHLQTFIKATQALVSSNMTHGNIVAIIRTLATVPPESLTEDFIKAVLRGADRVAQKYSEGAADRYKRLVIKILAKLPMERWEDFMPYIQRVEELLNLSRPSVREKEYFLDILLALANLPMEQWEDFMPYIQRLVPLGTSDIQKSYIIRAVANLAPEQLTERFIEIVMDLSGAEEKGYHRRYIIDYLAKVPADKLEEFMVFMRSFTDPGMTPLDKRNLLFSLTGVPPEEWSDILAYIQSFDATLPGKKKASLVYTLSRMPIQRRAHFVSYAQKFMGTHMTECIPDIFGFLSLLPEDALTEKMLKDILILSPRDDQGCNRIQLLHLFNLFYLPLL